jgi:hypothetical protein
VGFAFNYWGIKLNKLLPKYKNTILNSKIIIIALVMLVFVTGFSLGYQVCLYYINGNSYWFGKSQLTISVDEYNATFKNHESEE